jgi:hypothetical protein
LLQNDEFNILATDTRDLIHRVLEKEFVIMGSVRLSHVHVGESPETVGCDVLIDVTRLKLNDLITIIEFITVVRISVGHVTDKFLTPRNAWYVVTGFDIYC